jgi:hypothetical protein
MLFLLSKRSVVQTSKVLSLQVLYVIPFHVRGENEQISRVAFHGVTSHIFGNGILPVSYVPVSVFFGQYY